MPHKTHLHRDPSTWRKPGATLENNGHAPGAHRLDEFAEPGIHLARLVRVEAAARVRSWPRLMTAAAEKQNRITLRLDGGG